MSPFCRGPTVSIAKRREVLANREAPFGFEDRSTLTLRESISVTIG